MGLFGNKAVKQETVLGEGTVRQQLGIGAG
jgi:hypothetical protein